MTEKYDYYKQHPYEAQIMLANLIYEALDIPWWKLKKWKLLLRIRSFAKKYNLPLDN